MTVCINDALTQLDWQHAWLRPYARPYGRALAQAVTQQGLSVHAALEQLRPPTLCNARHRPLRFVPQQALPAGVAYEHFIHGDAAIPTRHHLHDFFNGLVWLHFPRAKARLNEIQTGQIERHGIGGRRGPVRDACTLLDENGALLLAPAPLWQALRERQWHALFGPLRPLWQAAQLVLFGHALLEQLCQPRKSITAHVLCLPEAAPAAPAGLPQLDAWLAAALDETSLAGKPFTPLPVLGVPGWWPANADASFYQDAQVFRPLRR